MTDSITIDREQFEKDGFFVARRLSNVDGQIKPLIAAYDDLFKRMLEQLVAETRNATLPALHARWSDLPMDQRFASLLGIGGHVVMDHLDPGLNSQLPTYRFRQDLIPAQLPELFSLSASSELLEAITQLLGDEVSLLCNPSFQLKLSDERQAFIRQVRRDAGTVHEDEADLCWKMHVGNARWHTAAMTGYRNAIGSAWISAWVPLATVNKTNARLKLIRGSHLIMDRQIPNRDELAQIQQIEAEPGDVVFMHNKLFHCCEALKGDEQFVWNIACQYVRTGEPVPRPHLPSVIVHSRSHPARVVRSDLHWSELLTAGLACHGSSKNSPMFYKVDRVKAEKLWSAYKKYHLDPNIWLEASSHGATYGFKRIWQTINKQRRNPTGACCA